MIRLLQHFSLFLRQCNPCPPSSPQKCRLQISLLAPRKSISFGNLARGTVQPIKETEGSEVDGFVGIEGALVVEV